MGHTIVAASCNDRLCEAEFILDHGDYVVAWATKSVNMDLIADIWMQYGFGSIAWRGNIADALLNDFDTIAKLPPVKVRSTFRRQCSVNRIEMALWAKCQGSSPSPGTID